MTLKFIAKLLRQGVAVKRCTKILRLLSMTKNKSIGLPELVYSRGRQQSVTKSLEPDCPSQIPALPFTNCKL